MNRTQRKAAQAQLAADLQAFKLRKTKPRCQVGIKMPRGIRYLDLSRAVVWVDPPK